MIKMEKESNLSENYICKHCIESIVNQESDLVYCKLFEKEVDNEILYKCINRRMEDDERSSYN